MSVVRLIVIPYDSGIRDRGLGLGPAHLMRHGLVDRLAKVGVRVVPVTVTRQEPFAHEMSVTFGLIRAIAAEVRIARREKQTPILLAGNCNSTLGALAGLGSRDTGLVWFDAHGDLNTPDTTTSGFIDGMALSMIVGHCWKTMTAAVPGFEPMSETRVVLMGAGDLDPAEKALLTASDIRLATPEQIRRQGAAATVGALLDGWTSWLKGVYIHMDMDVHDKRHAGINPYQPDQGLAPAVVRECVNEIAARLPILGASISAYTPECDPDDSGARAGVVLVEQIARYSIGWPLVRSVLAKGGIALQKIVFLDRDGVINQDSSEYIKNWDEFVFLPGSLEALNTLARAGFDVIVITNQSIINRKMVAPQVLEELHWRMRDTVTRTGGHIKDIFYCPHRPDENCACRKPRPGLIHRACLKYGIDAANAVMIGDSVKDIEAGRRAGCGHTILVKTGNGLEALPALNQRNLEPDAVADDLLRATHIILSGRLRAGS